MKKRIRLLLAIFLVPTLLSGCIILPLDDGYYHHGHHDYYDRGGRGGWYDRR